jgi:ribonuclease III
MARKRKSDSHPPAVQASNKKPRHYDDSQASTSQPEAHRSSQNCSSRTLPPLPAISASMSRTVFTHQSAVSNKDSRNQSASYERLEFLGDAYIEVMATRLVWETFKDLPAGRISQIRQLLVNNETLGKIAVEYGLDKQITCAKDVRANPKQWTKVKGDVMEAYIAAIVLEDAEMGGAGFQAAEKWLHHLWTPKVSDILKEKAPDLNAKDALSRKVVSRGVKLEYLEERPMVRLEKGQERYFIGAFITGWGYKKQCLGSGHGLSKTGAGNLAAENALQSQLTQKIAEMKRELDAVTKDSREAKPVEDEAAEQQSPSERMTRERELVEKKRNMFMSTEFG